MSKEITKYLKKGVLDDDFRKIIESDIETSFTDFDLTENEKRILRLKNEEMSFLVANAINDILDTLVGTKHESWGESEPVDYVTTQQSVMIRPIIVIPPPPVTITFPSPSPSPGKFTMLEHLSLPQPNILELASISKKSKSYDDVLRLVIAISESGYLDASPTHQKNSASNYDLYIVGLGIKNLDQITKETNLVLQKSKKIFYVENGIGVDEYLKNICSDAINLVSEYKENQDRMTAYRAMAARVLHAALHENPITLALYGHPTVFAYPPFLIKKVSEYLGLSVKVLPGISALDCICTDLMIDPGVNGMQMYEATEMLMRERPLLNDVPALIWQIGAIETTLYSQMPSKPERFEGLKNYLLKFYPPSHQVTSIFSSNYFLMPSTIYHFEIKDICDHAYHLHAGHTLYIPPSQYKEVADHFLASKIGDIEHLNSITEKK